ncbi:MAG: amino acid adenylation domain-containing protein [Pyrinomonadaceae bacterium]
MTVEGFRLSPQQKQLWEQGRHPPAFCAQCAVSLQGALDVEALKAASERVAARHEILRTRFRQRAGLKTPLQIIEAEAAPAWCEADLRRLAGTELSSAVERALRELRERPFDYEQGPLFELLLLRVADEAHVLALRLPALCADTLTLANLVRELAACLAGGAADSDEEAVQYLQFSEWQNDLLEDEESQPLFEYWRKKFETVGQPLQLPFAGPAVAGAGFEPAALSMTVEPAEVARMELAAAESGAGLQAFLLACWQTLLWRLTGRPDVSIAVVLDGRRFEELQEVVGLLARTVPVQAQFDEGQKFSDLVRRADRTLNEYQTLQEYFVPSGDGDAFAAEGALLAAFEYADWPTPATAGGVTLSLHQKQVHRERFRVRLSCLRQQSGALLLDVEYDRNAVGEEEARCLAGQLLMLARGAASAPTTRAAELELLTEEERRRADALNDTRAAWPSEMVHEMFEEQARKNPSAIALVFGEHHISYACLNRRADELARRLRALNVGPEVRVALWLERSPETVVGLLAVLKAGGAYVPLDTALPKQRLVLLLEESGAQVVITQRRFVEDLAGSAVALVVLNEEGRPEGVSKGTVGRAPRVAPEQLAYVLFTSGSTGRPKGVMVEHRQLANYVHGIVEKLTGFGVSTYAMVSTFAADLGNTVLFASLCGGGCLHLLTQEAAFDPDAFADYFGKRPLDCLKVVPSHLSNVLAASPSAKALPLRALILGGEAADRQLIDKVAALAPDCRIINHYGPTETTVGVMTHDLRPDAARSEDGMPLGRPLPNVTVRLLLDAMRPAPTWVHGELFFGGAAIARGYLNRPEQTAEKFIPDPFSAEPGARMYRTGDVAKSLPDGSIKFVGRADHQVKIRGFRVELGEIETLLRRHATVGEAVVELREHRPGESQLVAYVVPRGGARAAAAELNGFLQESLPDYMLPAAYVSLNSLPVTSNGKVDRRALPAPQEIAAEGSAYVAPRSLGEELMASLWREVLSVERPGVHDNFFRIGGDSLLATRLVSRVRKAFQVELPVHSIFEAPTVAEFTQVVERAMQGGELSQSAPLVPVPRDGDLPLSFAQARLWGIHQLDPHSPAYNSCTFRRLTGPLDPAAFERALDEIARRHEVLRTSFPSVDDHPVQHIAGPAPLGVRHVLLDGLPDAECEEEVRRLIQEEKSGPFDLVTGPVLRVSLLRLAPEHHILLLTTHHIVSDRWSSAVFMRELATLYDAFRRGLPSPLPELSLQYADFAHWQREALQGETLDKLLAYWTRKLAGAPEVIELPTDFPRPEHQTFGGGLVFSRRPPELMEALNALSRKEGVTLFMTLLSAFYTLLYHQTGQEDLVVGTDVANRNSVEVESLIGFFINNLALRANLAGNPTFRELLGQVRSTALEAYAHQDLPFATLVKAMKVKRRLSVTPLFQILFVLQNTPPMEDRPEGLEIEVVDTDLETSKFDIALFITETREGLDENWSYSTELFRRRTVEGLSHDFGRLLEGIVRHPDARLSELRVFAEPEKKKRSDNRWHMRNQSSGSLDLQDNLP